MQSDETNSVSIARPESRYIPQLDGIRALAIVLVLAVHTNGRFSGGILGVDLFFVLSGYLITSLLLAELARDGRIAAGNFYARRALRLLPALGVALLLVTALSHISGARTTDLALGIPVVLLYVTNWVIVYSRSPFGNLGPYWSLAIEEQFYLVWPWVIRKWAYARRLPEILVATSAGIMIVRSIWALHHWRGESDFTFFRADGLLLGAALAVILARGDHPQVLHWLSRPWLGPLALAGIAAVVGALLIRGTPTIDTAAYGCVGIAGALLIGNVVTVPSSPTARFLRTRPLVAIGRVSYGIYLFNFAILTTVQAQHWDTPTTIIVEYGALAIVVTASWFLVERRVLKLRTLFR